MKRIWEKDPVLYIRECVQLYLDKRVTQAAASLAYFMLLSVFPLLICISAFLGWMQIDTQELLAVAEGVIPREEVSLLDTYLEYVTGNHSAGFFAAGLVMVFTSASAAFRAVTKSMSDIYEVAPRRGLVGMLVSILFPLGLLLIIYLSIAVIVAGEWLLGWLAGHFPWAGVLLSWRNLRFLFLFLVVFVFVLLITMGAVPRSLPRGPILVGSVISSCALVGASALFSVFVGMSTRYSLVYGSLVSIIILLIWLYLCGVILLTGNVLSSVRYRRRRALGQGEAPVKGRM